MFSAGPPGNILRRINPEELTEAFCKIGRVVKAYLVHNLGYIIMSAYEILWLLFSA